MTVKRLPQVPTEPASASPAATWYGEGIRFECQRSGKCCTNHGEYAYVYLTEEDETRLVAHLGLAPRDFRRRYTVKVEGHRTLRSRDGGCIFLAGSDCAVHAAKPRQCSSWPFWRENLDPRVWHEEIAAFCPGVGQGRLWTRDEIEAIAARNEDDGGA